MIYEPVKPRVLSPIELAAFDRLRRTSADRLDRKVVEAGTTRCLVSADTPLRVSLHVLTLHGVRDDDTMGFSRSMAVVEVRERSAPYGVTGAPDAWGLTMRTLTDGVAYEHEALGGLPRFHVLPAEIWPPSSLQLKGPLAKHLRQENPMT